MIIPNILEIGKWLNNIYKGCSIHLNDLHIDFIERDSKTRNKMKKVNRKRQSDDQYFNQQTSKRNRSEQEPPSTQITDLNDDCLEYIFGYLSLNSLFNVAVSNALLRAAARMAYGRRFSAKTVNIGFSSYFFHSSKMPSETEDGINIVDIKTCLLFIRCFGPLFQNMNVKHCHEWNIEQCNHIDQYINQHCANGLRTLSFFRIREFLAENFQRPFVEVQSAQIKDANLDGNLASLVEWFPNVRRLEFSNVRVDRNCIKATLFNRLEQLTLDITNEDSTVGFSSKNVADILHSNQQLRSLHMRIPSHLEMTLRTMLKIIKNNPLISTLVMSTCRYNYVAHSAPVKTAELMAFARALPSLEILALTRLLFTADDIIALIRQHKSLKNCHFLLKNIAEYNYLKVQLGNEWQFSNRYPLEYAYANHRNRNIISIKREN